MQWPEGLSGGKEKVAKVERGGLGPAKERVMARVTVTRAKAEGPTKVQLGLLCKLGPPPPFLGIAISVNLLSYGKTPTFALQPLNPIPEKNL